MKKNEHNVPTTSPQNLLTLTAPDLWDRIAAWRETLAADRPLAARIRSTLEIEDGVHGDLILEYLRFTYLAWTMPAGATPSKTVDEVWHAHLLSTRSYEAYCSSTRGAVLHHEPGDGEADEDRFRQAYEATLARYEAEFGEPPARWWPRPATTEASVRQPDEVPTAPVLAGFACCAVFGSVLVGFVPPILGFVFCLAFLGLGLLFSSARGAKPRERRSGTSSGGNSGTCSGGGLVPGSDACADPGGGDGCGSSCGSGCGGGGCGGG